VTRRRTLQLVAVLAAGAVVLTGCSAKQEATHTLPTTTAAESTAALPALGPEDMPMPPEARTKDAPGAEAFVRYYVLLMNGAQTVTHASALRELGSDCFDCNLLAGMFETAVAAGKQDETDLFTLTKLGSPVITGARANVPIVMDLHHFPDDGMVITPPEGVKDVPGAFVLRWDAKRSTWLVHDHKIG